MPKKKKKKTLLIKEIEEPEESIPVISLTNSRKKQRTEKVLTDILPDYPTFSNPELDISNSLNNNNFSTDINCEYSNFSNSWIDSDSSILLNHSNNSNFDEDDVLLLEDNFDNLPTTTPTSRTAETNSSKDRYNKHELIHVQKHQKKNLN